MHSMYYKPLFELDYILKQAHECCLLNFECIQSHGSVTLCFIAEQCSEEQEMLHPDQYDWGTVEELSSVSCHFMRCNAQ